MPLTLHRFNVNEYYRMADVGVLKWGEHDELLNGVVMDPFYITPLHASVTHQIAEPFSICPKNPASFPSATQCGWTNTMNCSRT